MSDLVPPSIMPAMAATAAPPAPPVGPDTLIAVKILQNNAVNRRLKLPLRDLGAHVFPQKVRQFLAIPLTENIVLERYSDSLGNYILLDSDNASVYKQLYRAAKAKLKLRVKATIVPMTFSTFREFSEQPKPEEPSPQPSRYLETVLSSPVSRPAVSNDDISQSTQTMTSPVLSQSVHEERRTHPFVVTNTNHTSSMFCIDCNNCGDSIPGEHYHCSICDDGDYDLCPTCVDAGVSCPGDDHWLLKRLVRDGIIVNSTTETLAPRRLRSSQSDIPAENTAPAEEPKSDEKEAVEQNVVEEPEQPQVLEKSSERTCNACFHVFSETTMVSCNDCDDYDLCVTCLLKDNHGHHPGHEFSVIKDYQFCLKNLVVSRCRPGRHYHHAAICDGCEKRIVGVRHKCLTCPDWDYCWSCMKTAEHSHPQHRFVPIYGSISEPQLDQEVHYGIYCDGPLCRNKPTANYISGVRYKCAICHDTDFCAACEALPTSHHNRTHPLIKLRTPVRNINVNTLGDDGVGAEPTVMGDRCAPVQPSSVNAPSPNKPSTVVAGKVETEEAREEAHEDASEDTKENAPQADEVAATPAVTETAPKSLADGYNAYFSRDTISDGTSMPPSHVFTQTWSLYNPGPSTWPAGTSVRFVGGDAMFNVNTEHPSSAVALAEAMSSNELARPVAPSESANFSVTLKSSQRLGTSISYWRLKLPNGTPFGHKLWCDIKVVDEPTQSEAPLAGSNMIFPKLEKESPTSSIHESRSKASSTPTFTAPVSNVDMDGIAEDVESVSLEDVQSEDDAFLTDEEYDILDASDQESFSEKRN